jgi:hypothetical protein
MPTNHGRANMARHRIAARLWFGMNLKGRVRAAHGALERELNKTSVLSMKAEGSHSDGSIR